MTRRTRKVLGILILLSAMGVIAVMGALLYLAPRLRQGIAAAISEKTGRPVELSGFHWSLWPLSFRGEGLIVGARSGEEAPLARLGEFSVDAGLSGLLSDPRRIDALTIKDLEVWISRRPAPSPEPAQATPPEMPRSRLPVVIDRLVAENAHIEIASSDPAKPPRVFEIQRLVLDSLDLEQPVPYQARLRYQRPPGDLAVEGSFGPVDPAEPQLTPYSGTFDFRDADLGVFGGIAGLLTTQGSFAGTLVDTGVTGVADIPDFTVTRSGNIVPLHCRYQAEVREKGAVIELVEVETTFAESRLMTFGEVSRVAGRDGRRVALNVSSTQARVEDLVAFAVKSDEPPLTGAIELDTDVDIPPGSGRFIQRMTARGRFHIRQGRFSNLDIQGTLEKISQIGGGESQGEGGGSVVSNMRGQFLLQDARIEFSQLQFGVPGMELELTGSYTLEGEILDFSGTANLERSPSEMAPQQIAKWLQIIDPLLRGEKAGTVVPIKITGTRSSPKFSVEFRKLGR